MCITCRPHSSRIVGSIDRTRPRQISIVVVLVCLACVALRSHLDAQQLDAQQRVPGFRSDDGRRQIAGFGRDAGLHTKVTDVDRRAAQATLAKHDQNRNGVLDGAELYQAKLSRAIVLRTDRDGDERISLDEETLRWTRSRLEKELTSRRKARQAQHAAQQQPPAATARPVDPFVQSRTNLCAALAGEIIGQKDTNGNKQLEFSEWGPARRFGDLSRSDRDRNRVITPGELTVWLTRRLPPLSASRLAKPLRLLDVDGDGQIAMHEYAAKWTANKLTDFLALDTNDDGLISPQESRAPPIPKTAIRIVKNDGKAITLGGEVSSTIWVKDDIGIGHLDVLVAMTKQVDFQTRITLVGPDEQTVTLFAGGWQPWSGAALFESTLIDDEAALIETTLPQPPFPRRLRTDALKANESGLQQFYGSSARGSWRLVVTNLDNNVGVLHHWSLVITPK